MASPRHRHRKTGTISTPPSSPPSMSTGALYAALAFAIWGVFPLFFKQLAGVPPLGVLVPRILWSLVFVLIVLGARRQWGWLRPLRQQPKVLLAFAASALLLAAN